jgi:hypothetical protein
MASLVTAAAVIPALRAYLKVVVVKKPVASTIDFEILNSLKSKLRRNV